MRMCGAPSCDRPMRARGLCAMHYKRAKRTDELPAKVGREPSEQLICTVEGCDRAVRAGWLCNRHYENQRLRGDPVPRRDKPATERLRFEVTEAGCWEFTGKRNDDGYGVVSVTRAGVVGVRAHRLAYETWVGPIPNGLVVMHACDNPPCINPDHLSVGTHGDNMADMMAKGRSGRRGVGRVNEAMVHEIRAGARVGRTSIEMGNEFGLSRQAVRDIVTGRTWAWLTEQEAVSM